MASKGEKISKSKGNSKVEPRELVKTYSADSIRYWAGTGRLGNDIIFSEETLARGQKLINKLWNVAKFIEMHIHDYNENKEKFKEEVKEYNDLEYIDKWILAKYEEMEKGYLKYLEEYEIGIALNHLEKFFWNFCDDYIEIVKHRLYRPEEFGERARYSGQKTVYTLLFKLIQAFSIYLPYVTEEIYHELYMNDMNIPSIHITSIENLNIEDKNKETYLNIGNTIMEIISELRGEKTNNNVSLKTPFSIVEIDVNSKILDGITKAEKDFKATVTIENLKLNDKQQSLENNFNILKSELIIEGK